MEENERELAWIADCLPSAVAEVMKDDSKKSKSAGTYVVGRSRFGKSGEVGVYKAL